ncbi:MAG TPA: hypothetical protein VKU01_23490 [Bryobacteraceae bacterium]|nr:hypothetical protein [Bryobacteraceae bacterium]
MFSNGRNMIAIGVLLACSAAAQDKTAEHEALAACGPAGVSFQVNGDKSHHPTPAPENGKALLYLTGDAAFGVDGHWVGASTGKSYFTVSLDPGVHEVCARKSHWLPWFGIIYVWTKSTAYSVHELDTKAGETYYFGPQGGLSNPPSITSFELVRYNTAEGTRIVAASRFSTSHPK